MATRLNRNHSESCLKRIQTSQLINRLQDHALGKIELSGEQVRSACFLIERTLARAEAPKQLDIHGDLRMTVVSGIPQ